jgi:hypothetical protein
MTNNNNGKSNPSHRSPFINSSSSSSSSLKHKAYDKRKGIVFGAIAGFVAAIAFTGMILCMSALFRYPEGAFFDSIGILILGNTSSIESIGLSSLTIVLIQGILIGIIFGLITSKIKAFNPSRKWKGVGLGLLTGIISFIVLYLPMIYWSSIYQNLFSKTISIFSSSIFLSTRGTEAIVSTHIPMNSMIIWGLVSYLVYGFIMGGIVTLAYSVYNFDRKEIEKAEKEK